MAELVHELVLLRQILILVFDEVAEVRPLEVHVLGLLRELLREVLASRQLRSRKGPIEWESRAIAHGVSIGVLDGLRLGFGRWFTRWSNGLRGGLRGFCITGCGRDELVRARLSHCFTFWRHFRFKLIVERVRE